MIFDDILLICDMDGTLLNNNRQIDKSNLEAINYFISNGGHFSVATGRMETTIKDSFPFLHLNKPGIFHNGALIYDVNTRQYIFENPLANQVKQIIAELIDRFDVGVEILTRKNIHIIKQNIYTKEQQAREGFRPIYSDIYTVPFPWYKVLIAADNNILKKVREWVQKKDRTLNTVFSEDNLLDILATSVSKGSALSNLRSQLATNKIIVAVGDSYNDIELLKEADFAVAVDNAKSELKEVADKIIKDNNKSPINELIYYLKENKSILFNNTLL